MNNDLERVLIVDDDINLLKGLKRNLCKYYDVDTAPGGEEALAQLESDGPYQVLLVDMNMPVMNGIEFLEEARKISPEAIPLMLTGNADQSTAVQAINQGKVFHFLNKPCPAEEIRKFIGDAMNEYNLSLVQGPHSAQVVEGSIQLMQDLAAQSSPFSKQERAVLENVVSEICGVVPDADEEMMLTAVPMMSLYLTYLPSSIRMAAAYNRKMHPHEQKAVANALTRAHDLLSSIPPLAPIAGAVLYHKKNYDGRGIPLDDIKEKEIPLGARILRIATDYAEIKKQGLERKYAVARLCRRLGAFDPEILDALVSAPKGSNRRS
jgi:response regulator RpfG family c-di-GMP phosphodiesterase